MSKKHFSWLLIVTLVVAVLILLMPGKTGNQSSFEKSRLLPALADVVNEIEFVRGVRRGDETVAPIHRGENGWAVSEASDYGANWGALRTLLADLSQAEIVEVKTSNSEFYSRLGVEDIAQPEAAGILVEFGREGETQAVILGNSAKGREGQYVRLPDAEHSYLIDRSLEASNQIKDWLNREIIDIAADGVVKIEISHPDGEQVLAAKVSADDADFVLQNIPQGREAQSSWSVKSIAGSFSALNLESVLSESGLDWNDSIRIGLLTANGVQISAELVPSGEKYWIRLEAQIYQSESDTEGEDPGEQTEAGVIDDSSDTVTRINDRVSGWAYEIPQYKFESMTKRMDDVLKALEES
jgi:hypothetical protein